MDRDYNKYSAFQGVCCTETLSYIKRIHEAMPEKESYVMKDYGCSNGINSIPNIKLFKQLFKNGTVILNDVVDNNWDIVDTTVGCDSTIRFAKHSFYEASDSNHKIDFGYSNFALQWLSSTPSRFGKKYLANFIDDQSMAHHRKLWKDQSKEDMNLFLKYRDKEIVDDGFLLLGVQGTIGSGVLLSNMYDLLQETKETFGVDMDFVLPEWMRTMDEITDVVDTRVWEIVDTKTLCIECPIYEQMKRGMCSFEKYVEYNVGVTKSFVDRTLVGQIGRDRADRFWEIFHTKAMADRTGASILPTTYYHYVLLRKQSNP